MVNPLLPQTEFEIAATMMGIIIVGTAWVLVKMYLAATSDPPNPCECE